LFAAFHQIWHVAITMNAEQCAVESTSPDMCTVYTHYLVMLQETKL